MKWNFLPYVIFRWWWKNNLKTTWEQVSFTAKKKLQEKYKDKISFVTRSGKSDINSTLTEAWYNKRKISKTDEAESIIRAATKLRLIFILP